MVPALVPHDAFCPIEGPVWNQGASQISPGILAKDSASAGGIPKTERLTSRADFGGFRSYSNVSGGYPLTAENITRFYKAAFPLDGLPGRLLGSGWCGHGLVWSLLCIDSGIASYTGSIPQGELFTIERCSSASLR